MSYIDILDQFIQRLGPLGFESYPFKISWYNSKVEDKFKLPYSDANTLAVLVINEPSMFEKSFLPFIFEQQELAIETLNDPIDSCMGKIFDETKQSLKLPGNDVEIEIIRDFDLVPGTRRPKIVMQTCAHISGAAYYYDLKQVTDNSSAKADLNNNSQKKLYMGVCLHPTYGGWFAMRAVFIFKNLPFSLDLGLEPSQALDRVNASHREQIVTELLKRFNFNWKDGTYREVAFKVRSRYSPLQQEYFRTEPRHRKELLKSWLAKYKHRYAHDGNFDKINEDKYFADNFYLL